jgi:hypothetical protein
MSEVIVIGFLMVVVCAIRLAINFRDDRMETLERLKSELQAMNQEPQ